MNSEFKHITFVINLFLSISVIYGLFASDNGTCVEKADMIKHVREWEKGYIPEAVMLLFR